MRVTCSISVGSDETGDTTEATVEDESLYTPELAEDLLNRCAKTVLDMYEARHPSRKRQPKGT